MKITWIKTNYSIESDGSMIFHGSEKHRVSFFRMWHELTRSDNWCVIYCSATLDGGTGSRRANTWAEQWQRGMICGLIRPGGGLSNLVEKDDSGKPRWGVSGHLDRLERLSRSEAIPLEPLITATLGPAAWPGKVQRLLRGAPTKLEGTLAPLQRELDHRLAPALARVDAGTCP